MSKTSIHHIVSLLIISLIAIIVTFSNLGVKKELIGDDAGVCYHYSNTLLNHVLNKWDPYTFPGRSDVTASTALLHIGSINILNRLGLTPVFIDRLYYFLFYFVSGWGMYLLSFHICNKLFTTSKNNMWVASITGAVFYMLNNFTMILLSFPPSNYVYSYMLLSWIFLLYLKDFHVSHNLWKKLIFGITFLILLSGNPSNTISIIFLLLLYELFFRENNKIIHNWKSFALTFLLILLLSAYIFLPVLGNKGNPYGKILSSTNRASIAFNSSTTSFANLLRLQGHHSQDTFVFNEFLLRSKSIIVNCFLTAFSLLFLFKKKVKRIEIFFLSIFVLFLFLAKAEHSPFSWINKAIYNYVPLFEMYRASYFKFVYFCVFSLSIMMSLSILEIEKLLSRFSLSFFIKRVFLALPLFLIIFCAKPFWNGEVVRDIHKTTIPIEYHKINTYFSNIKMDFSVLSLPQSFMGLTLDWGNGNYYGGAAHPDMFMIGRPIWGESWLLLGNLPEDSISTELSFYKNILSKSNIKYVLLHKDIPEKYSFEVNIKGSPGGQTKFNKFNDQIKLDKHFKLVQDNKFFKIFKISDEYFLPHIYSSTTPTIINGNIEALALLTETKYPDRKPVLLFTEQMQEESKGRGIGKGKKNEPEIIFKKINPTKYLVKVEGAKVPFWLVFSESFHEQWRIYRRQTTDDRQQIFKEIVADYPKLKVKEAKHLMKFTPKDIKYLFKEPLNAQHQLVNGYANGWYVEPEKLGLGEDFTLVMYFWPQSLFYLGLGILGLTLLGCIGYLLWKRRK